MAVYTTLCTLDDGLWSPQFGDWSREVVEQERRDEYADYPRSAIKLIHTKGDQAGINEVVARLNEARPSKATRLLDHDQGAALEEYAALRGANWRERLMDDWRTGADVNAIANGGYLRQIRNKLGPSWLASYKGIE